MAQTPGADVAERLRLEVHRQRKSGRQLAAILGWSAGTASRRLNGASPLTVDELVAAATWLGLDPAELLPPAELVLAS